MKKKALIVALSAQLIAGVSLSWGATAIPSLPYTILTPGDYNLTKNLTSSGNGIIIATGVNNVSIDFAGYTISGNITAGKAISLANPSNVANNIEITNGTITNFGSGISLDTAQSVRLINMRITNINNNNNNSGDSVRLGDNALIKDSTFANVSWGVVVGDGSLITGCTNRNSLGNGFNIGSNGSSAIGNVVSGCGNNGITAGGGSSNTIKNNTVYGCQNYGIELNEYSFVDGNTTYNNNLSNGGFANIGPCPTCVFGNNVAP